MGLPSLTFLAEEDSAYKRWKPRSSLKGEKDMNRYLVKHYGEVLGRYRDRDWAEHSAECIASFYRITVALVDSKTGNVLAVKQPRLN